MDKRLMLNRIKEHYKFNSDSDFAKYLGITPQNLSNWKSRNTFDAELIYTKCEDINPEWLLTGKGEMLKKDPEKKTPEEPPQVQSVPELQQMVIDMQKREINRLQNEIDQLKKEHPLPSDHTKPTHSKQ